MSSRTSVTEAEQRAFEEREQLVRMNIAIPLEVYVWLSGQGGPYEDGPDPGLQARFILDSAFRQGQR